MTKLEFDTDGVDVEYEGSTFRLERELIEAATDKSYFSVTDHEVLQIIDPDPVLRGEARQIADLIE